MRYTHRNSSNDLVFQGVKGLSNGITENICLSIIPYSPPHVSVFALLTAGRNSLSAVRLSYFTEVLPPNALCGRQGGLGFSCQYNNKMKEGGGYMGRKIYRKHEGGSRGHLIVLPSAPRQISLWTGALCQDIFCYMCGKLIIDIRFVNTTNLIENNSYIMCAHTSS